MMLGLCDADESRVGRAFLSGCVRLDLRALPVRAGAGDADMLALGVLLCKSHCG